MCSVLAVLTTVSRQLSCRMYAMTCIPWRFKSSGVWCIGDRTTESGYQSKEKTASLLIRKLRTDIFSAVCVQEGW